MSVKDRIQEYIDYKGISIYRLEASAGLSKGYWAKTKSISADVVMRISGIYTDISAEWLLRGIGEMLKSQSGMGESASNVIQGNHNSNNVQHIAEGDRREVDHLKEIIRMKDALLKCKESENELLREIIKKKEGHE